MIKRLILIGCLCMLIQNVCSQTVKTITVSHLSTYTDHLTLSKDASDKDLMVKFIFNEGENTLTVSLISYRSIFVFWDQVRYKPVLWNGKLRPALLPYVTEGNPDTKIRLSKKFKRSIPVPRKDHVFNRWIYVEGLQPVPVPYKLINDVVEQKFDIVGKRDMVKVTLHDILLLDKKNTRVGRPDHYEISFSTDLNIQYQILIARDPCFGLEEDLTAAQNAVDSAKKGAESIKNRFGTGKVATEDLLNVFTEMKGLFIQQFPLHKGTSNCPAVNQAWEEYNDCVSEIAALECSLVHTAGGNMIAEGVDPHLLLSKAHQIDNLVSRWLLTGDIIERRDIIASCDAIVAEIDELVNTHGIMNDEQRQALNVFREAQQYFKNNCKL